MTDQVDVIDISHHQATVDFNKVEQAGVVGVILKCTEGKSVVDPTFKTRFANARNAGLEVASYHFLRPGDMDQQMAFYLKTLKPRMGDRVIIDHEDDKVPLKDLVRCVEILLADPADLQVTIYSGHLIKQQLGAEHNEVLAKTSLWLAQYGSTPSWPRGTWPTFTLWQYSDKGAVAGVSGNCDVNHFNGSKDNCRRWMTPAVELQPGSAPEAPLPPPAVLGDTMLIDITTTATVSVSVRVNGVVLNTGPVTAPV